MATNYPGSLDSFATDVDNITTITAAESNNQSAAILALEKYGQPIFSVRGFGAKGDGSTDDTAAFQAAIDAAVANKGAVLVPYSPTRYAIAGQLDLTAAGADGLEIFGQGSALTGSTTPSVLNFTGTASPLIKMAGRTGQRLRDLKALWANNAFAGTAVDLSGSSLATVQGCYFGQTGGSTGLAAVCIGLDQAVDTLIDHCQFQNYTVGVQGLSTGGHFSNAVTIRGKCIFSSATGTAVSAHISNPGQAWEITGNVFEMGQAAGNAVVVSTPISNGPGITFTGNWVGDQGANAVTQLSIGSGWHIAGNYLGGAAAATAISVPNNAIGIVIAGNEFQTYSVGTLIGTTVNRIIYAGNDPHSVTTEISGTPNSGGQIFNSGTQILYGATQVQGLTQYTAQLLRSSQAPSFAASYTPNLNLGESVEMTLTGAITVNAPSNGGAGARLLFKWLQDGTGGRVITYNAVYKTGGGTALATTASTMTLDLFECSRDGTTWRLVSRITGQ